MKSKKTLFIFSLFVAAVMLFSGSNKSFAAGTPCHSGYVQLLTVGAWVTSDINVGVILSNKRRAQKVNIKNDKSFIFNYYSVDTALGKLLYEQEKLAYVTHSKVNLFCKEGKIYGVYVHRK